MQADFDAFVADRERRKADSKRLEFAMEHLMITASVGPQTQRIYDTRGAIDEAIRKAEGVR